MTFTSYLLNDDWSHHVTPDKGEVIEHEKRDYDNQQGQRVYVTEVQVEEVQLINTGNQNNNQQNHQNNGNQVGGWGGNQADTFPTEPLGVTDSDLPF